MFKKFEFDYDAENGNLFIYDPKSKSKASIEMDDLVIDFNSKKQISAIEIFNAKKFLGSLIETKKINLNDLKQCKIDISPKHNFIMIKILLMFKQEEALTAPLLIPSITEPSPILAC